MARVKVGGEKYCPLAGTLALDGQVMLEDPDTHKIVKSPCLWWVRGECDKCRSGPQRLTEGPAKDNITDRRRR